MSRSNSIETLEPRRLFAGVTLIATGRLGNNYGWLQTMADSITNSLGGKSQVPQYELLIQADPNTGALVPSISHFAGTATPQTNTSGEIIVTVNYFSISANASYSSTAIGQVIGNYLLSNPVDGVTLASLPIHEIALSRGTALFDGANVVLGKAGVWVDQQTYIDPNPLSAQGDPASTLYDNVEFADDYWRNDGSVSQANDGNPVSGAYNLNIYWIDSEAQGYAVVHVAPAGYYIGTIDQNATQSGDGPIYPQWYGTTPTMPARNATGWIYSALVGSARPLSGVWSASGGSGTRTPTGQTGTQWGNVADLNVSSGSTFTAGSQLQVNYIHQDRDSADTVTFYLDSDRNPYNGAFAATLGSVNLAQTGTTAQATATLSTAGVAPGNYWLCAKTTDAQGDVRYAYEAITAPLTATPLINPIATLATPATIISAGTQPENLVVTYTGSAPINIASFDNSDLQVSGPGYTTQANYVGVDANNGSNTRVATYSVAAPTGGWPNANNGAYSITLQANQVSDTSARSVAAGVLGSFNVNVPVAAVSSLSGVKAAAASGYNLTSLGASDWAHWGRGNNAANFDHKSTGNSQISNVTKLGSGSYGSYYDNSRSVNWTDGSPTSASSGDNAYLWANTALGAGYSFTVPADPTTRTLYVYAGGYSSGGTLTAHLSDGSAVDFVATASGNAIYTNLYTITYKSASAGQKLTVSLTKSTNINGTGGSVDLIAAMLAVTPVAPVGDTIRPTALLGATSPINIASTAPYLFTVTYSDNVSVNAATLGNNNLLVTGTGYNQAAKLVSSALTNGPMVVATYSVSAPAGGWTLASNGSYNIALQANQVADTSGNFAQPVGTLGAFAVNIPQITSTLSDGDIGSPGLAGSGAYNSVTGVWTLSGSGSDIWNSFDQFNFASASVTGDTTLIAKVTSLSNTDPWAKAGIMFRDGSGAGAANLALVATPGNGVSFQWRSVSGGISNYNNFPGVASPTSSAPVWLKIVRVGNFFTASYSTDGTNYTVVGSQVITLSSTLLGGLAVTSHNNNLLTTATFANVSIPSGGASVSIPATPPLNAVAATGSVSLSWNAVAGATSYNLYRSTTAGGEGNTPYLSGLTGGAYTDNSVAVGTAYFYTLSAVNAAGPSGQSTEVSATPAASSSPALLSDGDIGSPGLAGSGAYNSGSATWTVTGGGSDIWNSFDQFNFASASVTGDNTLVAKVTSLTNTDPWAKAGVMFRDGAGANAANVALVATPGNGVSFQWRTSAGGTSNYTNIGNVPVPTAAAPVWLKLVRAGNLFTASYSTDGVTYTVVGSQTIALSNSLLAGLAVTSHNNGLLATGTFTNVSV